MEVSGKADYGSALLKKGQGTCLFALQISAWEMSSKKKGTEERSHGPA